MAVGAGVQGAGAGPLGRRPLPWVPQGLAARGAAAMLAAWTAAPLQAMALQVLGGVLPPGAAEDILRLHNQERAALGVPPLRWDQTLAATALQCAQRLAASGQFRHCRSGENLWMGSTGSFTPTQMANLWADERRFFQAGAFPRVSRSGNWQDVGHYTQMVWRTTTSVGCAAVAGTDGRTRLVCHYAPPGNVYGRPVF